MFRSFLVKDANYHGKYELPCIKTSDKIPNKVITFSKAMSKSCKDFDAWVIFYEDDERFERIWNNPKAYIEKLKKFNGVISPDFSLYRNMPLVMQQWNTYRGRAIADGAKTVDKISDTVKAIDKVADTSKTVRKSKKINSSVLNSKRIGSATKADKHHSFNDIEDISYTFKTNSKYAELNKEA